MKHLIVFVTAIFFSVQLTYADSYQVFSFEKSVYVRKGINNWHLAKKKEQINKDDSIKLGASSTIKILEVSSGQTYEWKEQGKYKVTDILKECISRKANWIQRLFTTLIQNVTDEPNRLWHSLGSVKKGVTYNDILEHTLAKELMSCYYKNSATSSELILKPQSVGKNEYYFDITNNTSNTLYVNVLAINTKQESYKILYDIRNGRETWMVFPVAPKSTLSLSDFTVCEKKKFKYVVFGTARPIEILKLEKYLNKKTKDDILPQNEDIIVIGTEKK